MKTIIEQTPTPGKWWKEERKDLRGNPVGFSICAKNPLAHHLGNSRVIIAKTPDCWSPQVQANTDLLTAAPAMKKTLDQLEVAMREAIDSKSGTVDRDILKVWWTQIRYAQADAEGK